MPETWHCSYINIRPAMSGAVSFRIEGNTKLLEYKDITKKDESQEIIKKNIQ
jgi:hypothetical protein